MSAEMYGAQYDVLAPVLDHFPEKTQKVNLPGPNTRTMEKSSPCETHAAMLGAFATGRGVVHQAFTFGVLDSFELSKSEAVSQVDLGLERLHNFAEPHIAAFEHVAKSAEEIIWDNTNSKKIEFLAGVQVMFDTEYGSLRPELVYNIERLEDVAFTPQAALMDLYCSGINISRKQLEGNDLAMDVLNPSDDTRIKLSVAAASMILPRSLDELL